MGWLGGGGGGHLLGLITPLGQELTILLSSDGKPSILVCFRRGLLDYALTISLFYLVVAVFKGVKNRSSSGICG
jgi:hypothetical protein